MFKTIYFIATDHDSHYADATFISERDYRPVVGDMFVEDALTVGDSPDAYEIEQVVYMGDNIFHAYCLLIEDSDEGRHKFGIRGNKGTFKRHALDQINAFPQRYEINN
ncbi:MAG: hypothetical protein AAF702_37465 [Chloroflexota bacterium]